MNLSRQIVLEGLTPGSRQARPFLAHRDPSVLLREAEPPFRDLTALLDPLKRDPLGGRKGDVLRLTSGHASIAT
jgi:hypothetical protein